MIYDYENNIKITNTPSGDKVIIMNEAILTLICNEIWDAGEYQSEKGLDATSKDTLKLWTALTNKMEK